MIPTFCTLPFYLPLTAIYLLYSKGPKGCFVLVQFRLYKIFEYILPIPFQLYGFY